MPRSRFSQPSAIKRDGTLEDSSKVINAETRFRFGFVCYPIRTFYLQVCPSFPNLNDDDDHFVLDMDSLVTLKTNALTTRSYEPSRKKCYFGNFCGKKFIDVPSISINFLILPRIQQVMKPTRSMVPAGQTNRLETGVKKKQ